MGFEIALNVTKYVAGILEKRKKKSNIGLYSSLAHLKRFSFIVNPYRSEVFVCVGSCVNSSPMGLVNYHILVFESGGILEVKTDSIRS